MKDIEKLVSEKYLNLMREPGKPIKRDSVNSTEKESLPKEAKPKVSFWQAIQMYETTFICLLAFQYFNQGSKALLGLGQKDYLKEHLGLDPSEMTYLETFIGFPWSVKILYGIISDNFPIFGHYRKSYVILMGFIQFASLFYIFMFLPESKSQLMCLLFLCNMTGAFLDVIVDALMVTQSRQDSEEGSEQLNTLSWLFLGFGGMFGSLFGGYLTNNFHPKWSFLLYGVNGLIVMVLGFLLKVK